MRLVCGHLTWAAPTILLVATLAPLGFEATRGATGDQAAVRRFAGHDQRQGFLPVPEGAWAVASVIVARPGATTMDINILAANDIRGRIEYWEQGSTAVCTTREQEFKAGEPAVIRLQGLKADTGYGYRLVWAENEQETATPGPQYGFHTQRAPGSSFVFEIQGDSHPERLKENDPALYAQTLRAVANDHPDFYIAMGDDFSVDTLREVNAATVEEVYLGQRHYLGQVGQSAPLFLVNGNHEQAALCNLDGTGDNVAVWAQNCREKYFSQPAPEGIYTGNTEPVEHIGFLRNYYASTWGDALFVVIDPYWHTRVPVDNVFGGGEKTRDLWQVTLGRRQYVWLRQTLAASDAPFKFVFAHHVHGTTRGGAEQAGYYEWGGQDRRGTWAFDAKRPGWELPIHQLMAQTGVTIFFQGHDHIFCKQVLDGVVYQTLPEPADPSCTLYNADAYLSGDVLPNSGRLRVTVSPRAALVEYIRSYLPGDATAEHPDGEVAYSYEVSPRTKSTGTDNQEGEESCALIVTTGSSSWPRFCWPWACVSYRTCSLRGRLGRNAWPRWPRAVDPAAGSNIRSTRRRRTRRSFAPSPLAGWLSSPGISGRARSCRRARCATSSGSNTCGTSTRPARGIIPSSSTGWPPTSCTS
jgi:hypothetical protein